MFTKIAKVILSIFAIIVFVLAAIISNGNELMFFVILVFGGILLFNFGLFVELASNVKDMKDLVKQNTAAIKSLNNKISVISKENNVTKQETSQNIIDVKL